MCIRMCDKCGASIFMAPCMYHIQPEEFKKRYPKKFAQIERDEKEATARHKCRIIDQQRWAERKRIITEEMEKEGK